MADQTRLMIIFFVVLGFLALGALIIMLYLQFVTANRLPVMVQQNAGDVDSKAATIAEFRLPEGYKPATAVDFGAFKTVIYKQDEQSQILLFQTSAGSKFNPADFEQMLRSKSGSSGGKNAKSKAKLVETRTLHIDGQPVEFAVSEGTNSDRQPYRVMLGTWAWGNQNMMLSIEEPLDRWNQAEIDAFIASIRPVPSTGTAPSTGSAPGGS